MCWWDQWRPESQLGAKSIGKIALMFLGFSSSRGGKEEKRDSKNTLSPTLNELPTFVYLPNS